MASEVGLGSLRERRCFHGRLALIALHQVAEVDGVLEARLPEVTFCCLHGLGLQLFVHLHQVRERALARTRLVGRHSLPADVLGTRHRLLFGEPLDLTVQLLDNLFSLAHDAQVRLVHVICAKQVFRIYPRFREYLNLVDECRVIQVQLRERLPDLDNVRGRLLLLKLNDKVLELVDSLGQALRVGGDWIDTVALTRIAR